MARQFCAALLTKRFSTNAMLNTYESSVSLKKLYPNSSLDIARSIQAPSSSDESFSGYIPIDDLDITYSRSSGPGGQNVNKVNSKVDLRFHLEKAKWLPDDIKPKIIEKFTNYINAEGYFIVKSDRTRSQQMNLADAIDKLRYMIHRAIFVIPPRSDKDLEISRRRQEKASRERLRVKREKSLVKRDRQGFDIDY